MTETQRDALDVARKRVAQLWRERPEYAQEVACRVQRLWYIAVYGNGKPKKRRHTQSQILDGGQGTMNTNPAIAPIYVNPKQYHRIKIRREQRENLHKRIRFVPKKRNYQYASRHKHAMRRRRGPGGRFLTKQELAALEAKERELGLHVKQEDAKSKPNEDEGKPQQES